MRGERETDTSEYDGSSCWITLREKDGKRAKGRYERERKREIEKDGDR